MKMGECKEEKSRHIRCPGWPFRIASGAYRELVIEFRTSSKYASGVSRVCMFRLSRDDVSGGLVAGSRWLRSALERRRVVEETLEAGACVAWVTLRHGVNAKQVFQRRRPLPNDKLGAAPQSK